MNTTLTEFLYYNVEQEGYSYSVDCTGNPDVERLIAGHPDFWISPIPPESEYKKKKLVLIDWTLANRGAAFKKQCLKNLLSKCEQGFELWVWKNSHIHRLSLDNLNAFFDYKLSNIGLAHKETILQALVDNGINPDTCALLSFSEWAVLNGHANEHVILVSSLLTQNIPIDDCINYLLSFHDNYRVIMDTYSKDSWSFLKQHRGLLESLGPIINEFRTVNIDNDILSLINTGRPIEIQDISLAIDDLSKTRNIFSLIEDELDDTELYDDNEVQNNYKEPYLTKLNVQRLMKAVPNIQCMELCYLQTLSIPFVLLESSLRSLRYIDLSHTNISSANLEQLLLAAPNLEKIVLNKCKNIHETLKIRPASLLQLEEINFTESNISSDSVEAFLNAAPNLKKINLHGSEHLSSPCDIKAGSLLQLKEIDFMKSKITSESLKAFLSAAPNLEKIDLEGCKHLSSPCDIKPGSLPQLKKIKFTESKITSEILKAFLSATPNLKKIDLEGCKYLSSLCDIKPGSLPQLKEINFTESNISSESVKAFLSAAPNLEKIYLVGCKHLSSLCAIKAGSLRQLKKIDFMESKITSESLKVFLSAAPNLEKIYLGGCKHLSSLCDIKPGSLLQLKEINFTESKITSESLKVFLSAAPNLEKIDLGSCKHLSSPCDIKAGSLLQLKEIDFMKSKITSESLKAFLSAAPNLEKIDLEGCKHLSSPCDIKPGSLPQLKKIKFTESKITSEILKAFLSATPNLKKIDLEGCKHLSSLCDIKPGSLPQLKEINFTESNISSDSVEAFLNAAPNLKKINLHGSEHLSSPCDIKAGSLLQLKEIDFMKSKITSESLKAFLSAAPNLEKIDLEGCKHLSSPCDIKPGSLLQLKEVDFTESNISSELATPFFLAAPNLEVLRFKGCKNLSRSIAIKPKSLPMLKKAFFDKSNISSKNIEAILLAASSIEKVSLGECTNLAMPIVIEPRTLMTIKEINAQQSNMSISFLQTLLSASSSLETISIFGCQNLEGWLQLKLRSLTYLKYICLLNSNLSLENLEVIQQAAEAPLEMKDEKSIVPWAPQPTWNKGSKSASKQENEIFILPQYQLERYYNLARPRDFRFEYKAVNKSFNQKMLIEQLSQYLTIKKLYDNIIPDIQQGMCTVFSRLALTYKNQWQEKMAIVCSWNGTESDLTKSQILIFNEILECYLDSGFSERVYLGKATASFLKKNPGSYILNNNWHSIAVYYDDYLQIWHFYDPNNPDGIINLSSQEISPKIEHSLGELVNVNSHQDFYIPYEECIPDPDRFLEHGGFLTISNNHIFPAPLIQTYLNNHPTAFSSKAIQGLLIRSTSYCPAWIYGLGQSHTSDFFKKCLNQLISENPDVYHSLLLNSLSDWNSQHKASYMKQVEEIAQTNQSILKIQKNIRQQAQIEALATKYYQMLKSMNKTPIDSALLLLDTVQTVNANKILIEVSNNETHEQALLTVYQQAKQNKQPLYFIEKPEDLYCSANWIKKEGNLGVVQKGPGGELYNFLKTTHLKKHKPVILINYNSFKKNDNLRFNNLLDKTRKADGIDVPEANQIIGGQNICKQNCYRGGDFTSRFDVRLSYQPGSKEVPDTSMEDVDDVDVYHIELYQAADWRKTLLGYWTIEGFKITFKEGILESALQSERNIIISNGPESDALYSLFWKRFAIDRPEAAKRIKHRKGYQWPLLYNRHQIQNARYSALYERNHFLLNKSSLCDLLRIGCIDNHTGSFHEKKGLLETSIQQDFYITVTESLNSSEWARLLDTANKFQVRLFIDLLPGLVFPEEMGSIADSFLISEEAVLKTPFMYSEDADVTIVELKKISPNAQVIDVSELNESDLLFKTRVSFNQETQEFHFKKEDFGLLSALKRSSGDFILKGKFRPSLIQKLLPAILSYASRIVLVSENPDDFKTLGQSTHQVTFQKRYQCLSLEEQELLNVFDCKDIENHSLSKLKALCRYQQSYGDNRNAQAPWHAYYALSLEINSIPGFKASEAERDTIDFIENRFEKIEKILLHSPFVFIGGLTGIGKSYFMDHYFRKKYASKLYWGEDRMEQWLNDSSGGYLFIDEANINRSEWSCFEGLLENSPYIFFRGKFCSLSKNHKLIFAGNPMNYGGLRHMAKLFERHGSSIEFTALSPNVIYQQILKPMFANTTASAKSEALSAVLLEVYRFLLCRSKNHILITPRQIKSIVMLTLADFELNPHIAHEKLLKHYIRQILRPALDKNTKAQFDQSFPAIFPQKPNQYTKITSTDFLITPSRQEASKICAKLLSLRSFKQKYRQHLTNQQKCGDICSLVLESMPQQGKTELLKALMKAANIPQATLHEQTAIHEKNLYYLVPVTMSYEDKITLLKKAFHEGNIVIMDEMNASPMMESLLNALLSGKTPEGEFAKTPGFLLLSTQNPESMGGRQQQTQAADKRTIKLVLDEYTIEEITNILCMKNADIFQAKALAAAGAKAQKNNFSAYGLRALETILQTSKRPSLADNNLFKRKRSDEQVDQTKNKRSSVMPHAT